MDYKGTVQFELNIDDWIQQNLYFLGTYHEKELLFVDNFLKKGDVFIDAGANIGLFSLVASRKIENEGQVFAFEPYSKSYNKILRHLEINGISNIVAEWKALSDKNGETNIYINNSEHNSGMATIYPDKYSLFEAVAEITLDEYLLKKNIDKISLIKIDIEGSEYYALKGMHNTLVKFRPAVMIELDPDIQKLAGQSSELIIQFFSAIGYTQYYISEDGALNAEEKNISPNSVFIPGYQ